jgi:two-component system sensor histidine kinase ChvG
MARRRKQAWSGHWTLTHRILAVNILTVALFFLSMLFLDLYRDRLIRERERQARVEVELAAAATGLESPDLRLHWLGQVGKLTDARYRLFAPDGTLVADSWKDSGPTYQLADPLGQSWTKRAARSLDRGFNAIVGQPTPFLFQEPQTDVASAWPEIGAARSRGTVVSSISEAPDMTPVITAAAMLPDGSSLLSTRNDVLITHVVRRQRANLAAALAAVTILSVLLSLFLARTIVRPLRRIAIAAHRVRLGRAREVRVPRLPARHDEIGLLARSISDMSQSLRQRIDNIEAFAADVTHELKNPLASLRSAVDGLSNVKDESLRERLIGIAREDVVRLDRLIGDVGEAARTDAELARANFEPVDLGPLIEQLITSWETRRTKGDVRIAYARPRKQSAVVMGDPARLARAIDNVIDNAVSFSPAGGLVEIAASRVGSQVRIRVDDEGPGVPPEEREAIFNRFHSIRPESEDFGRHSGLGLAIAKAIVEGHDGQIDVKDRDDAPSGARFTIRLPAAEQQ